MKKYYRKITERLPKSQNLASHMMKYLASILISLAAIFGFTIGLLYFKAQDVIEERKRAQDSLSYWESVVKKNPKLPDAFYNAALYSVKLSDNNKANEYLNRALELDPDFKSALSLRSKISK